MSRQKRLFTLMAACAALIAPPAAADITCDADVDGSGVIDIDDLFGVLAEWGPCDGCPGDIDDSGVVDIDDVFAVLADWGPCLFDYGEPYENTEAEQIGLEMLGPYGPLLLPEESYNRIVRDQDLIRTDYPGLLTEFHDMAWMPNEMIVKLIEGEPLDMYEAYNTYYQVIDEYNLFGTWWVLTLAGNINVPGLVVEYLGLDAVEYAEPNGLIGGQNFWQPVVMAEDTWRWNIDDGFHDCTDGCDCHRYYVIDVEADGTVILVSYEEVGPPYCDFGAPLR
ncbi:MAG: hypothetical protein JSV91_01920 [Phycisphaerales bacterium]|nr:MAG: hypothetical protein JSV91_01920 [Phycisphaerales bacterium]